MSRTSAQVQEPRYVYVLKNNVTGRYYVGQTRNFENRLRWHRKNLKWVIGRAIRKHGIGNFSYLVHKIPAEIVDRLEVRLIRHYNSLTPNGYNVEGGGCKQKFISEESRKKNSIAHLGIRQSMVTRRKISEAQKNRVRTPEMGRHISEAKRGKPGRPIPPETRKKISEALKGRPNNFAGKHHSLETRAKMSESHRRRLAAKRVA